MTPAPPSTSKRLIVCADDYAFTPGVSRAIRELLAAKRLSATSVMTGSPHWPDEAEALKGVADKADIGLHLTLTDQQPIGAMPRLAPAGKLPSMPSLYGSAVRRGLPLGEIKDEIERQADAFIARFGRPPAHIDGHHHVHQLPGIRDCIVGLAQRLGREAGRPVWVRCCRESPRLVLRRGVASTKALLISAFGRATAQRAASANVPVNNGFSGAYDYNSKRPPMAELFGRFILGAGDNALVMCHPGYSDPELARLDIMTTARDGEYAFLIGPDWLPLVSSRGFEIGPYRHAV